MATMIGGDGDERALTVKPTTSMMMDDDGSASNIACVATVRSCSSSVSVRVVTVARATHRRWCARFQRHAEQLFVLWQRHADRSADGPYVHELSDDLRANQRFPGLARWINGAVAFCNIYYSGDSNNAFHVNGEHAVVARGPMTVRVANEATNGGMRLLLYSELPRNSVARTPRVRPPGAFLPPAAAVAAAEPATAADKFSRARHWTCEARSVAPTDSEPASHKCPTICLAKLGRKPYGLRFHC
jgi:hypothetical protein